MVVPYYSCIAYIGRLLLNVHLGSKINWIIFDCVVWLSIKWCNITYRIKRQFKPCNPTFMQLGLTWVTE